MRRHVGELGALGLAGDHRYNDHDHEVRDEGGDAVVRAPQVRVRDGVTDDDDLADDESGDESLRVDDCRPGAGQGVRRGELGQSGVGQQVEIGHEVRAGQRQGESRWLPVPQNRQ